MYVQMYLCGITLKTLPINLLLLCVRDVFVLFFLLFFCLTSTVLKPCLFLIGLSPSHNGGTVKFLTGLQDSCQFFSRVHSLNELCHNEGFYLSSLSLFFHKCTNKSI